MPRLARSTTLLLFFALVVAVPANLPIGMSYVVSDSMAPTIHQGDGFVRVPAGNVEPGEIVVFESPASEHRYTVHRVVRETPRGFVTKGDNNDATDQAAGHPYVDRSRIRGEVLAVAGAPVTIPHLGAVLKHDALLLAAVVALLIIDLATASPSDRPSRPATVGDVLRMALTVSSAALIVLLVLGGSSTGLTFVAVEGGADAANTVPAGEPAEERIRVEGLDRMPLTHVAVDTGSTVTTNRTWNGSTLVLTMRLPPQKPGTVHRSTVRVHRYPASLPPSIIDELHELHPLVAATATTFALMLPLYLLALLLVNRRARLRTTAGRWGRWVRRARSEITSG